MDREFLENLNLQPEAVEAILTRHDAELKEQQFDHLLDTAIQRKHGRSGRAIRAMLDVEALRSAEDPAARIDDALETLKKDSGYLFEAAVPVAYSAGAGTGAFRKHYTREELGRMSMEEYKAYRQGR